MVWVLNQESSGMMFPLLCLQGLRIARPELCHWYEMFADLYQKKLWHQLTLALERFLVLPIFHDPKLTSPLQTGDTLIQLYNDFITDFETKINLLKLAHIAVTVSQQYTEKEAAISHLEGVIEKIRATQDKRVEEPILHIKMRIALLRLEHGETKECMKLLDDGKTALENMTDIDPSVYAAYYWVSSKYYKLHQEFAAFYKNALLYLAYTSMDSLSETFKLDLAVDLSLAALLGDNIYNFGELLAHSILTCLFGTEAEWLYYVLHAVNSGNLVRYQELCLEYKDAFDSQPALVADEKKLLEKINILRLMEIISSRPPKERTIPLSEIAGRTNLSVEDVEHLLMKSLSVHLIEGLINQVEGTVHVTWVQPRVVGIVQVELMWQQVGGYLPVEEVADESETPELVAGL